MTKNIKLEGIDPSKIFSKAEFARMEGISQTEVNRRIAEGIYTVIVIGDGKELIYKDRRKGAVKIQPNPDEPSLELPFGDLQYRINARGNYELILQIAEDYRTKHYTMYQRGDNSPHKMTITVEHHGLSKKNKAPKGAE